MAAYCSTCCEELSRLNEENEGLRRTALALGSIAERLNVALREERRLNRAAQQELAAAGRDRA